MVIGSPIVRALTCGPTEAAALVAEFADAIRTRASGTAVRDAQEHAQHIAGGHCPRECRDTGVEPVQDDFGLAT
ncbi:hypothetical protein [Streptomyces bathyalis]|uniref:hypothetical protein n=1 Tax=Streptomyces bathyalis TaxID=2710756 RepID=UPI0018D191AB|nr:hypothetical protein [Streptomyces bathyalis]